MSLTAEGLSVRLGGRHVLDGVSLRLDRGGLVGLVGPNGAGKTTLLRALAGLAAPAAGRILLDGRSLTDLSRDERARRIAALFQGEGVGWSMRVEEIVALGRLPHRRVFADLSDTDRASIGRAMALTDIVHLVRRTEPTLSSGERMRVLLARALAVEAEWLLADEPITALDPAHQLDAMGLLRAVAQGGTGVVAVLHDLSLAARFCDRLVVLSEGRIAADGEPDTALSDDRLAAVFGVGAARGRHADGTPYILPWTRLTPQTGDENP